MDITLIEEYNELAKQIKELEKRQAVIAKQFIEELNEANTDVYQEGKYIISNKQFNRTSFDSSTFKKENEEIYNKYVKTTTYNVFKISEN